MRVDDFVDVVAIEVRIPDCIRVHDDDRPFLAAVETACLVDADFAFAGKAERLDPLLRIFLHLERAGRGATPFGRVSLVAAKKDVAAAIAHRIAPIAMDYRGGQAPRPP